jgi:hypothetical protein
MRTRCPICTWYYNDPGKQPGDVCNNGAEKARMIALFERHGYIFTPYHRLCPGRLVRLGDYDKAREQFFASRPYVALGTVKKLIPPKQETDL